MLRQKRHKPNRKELHTPWVYTKMDEQVLMYLSKYRYLRGTSLHQLIDAPHQTINFSLRKLYDKRLIDKPKQQRQGYNTLNDTDIYEILDRGRDRLAIELPTATHLIRKSKFPIRNFEHAMMICDALSSIEIGATKAGVRFISQGEILERVDITGNPLDLPCTIRHKDYREETTIRPDGFFGLGFPEGGYRFFFLEAERSNPIAPSRLNRASFLKKIIAYTSVKARKSYINLGIKGFAVLFVFQTKGELIKPKETIEAMYKSSPLFLLNHIPTQQNEKKAPKPKPELFDEEWVRGGMEPATLSPTA